MTTAYTYILQCANGQYYVGSTTDLDKRLQEHQAGLGAKFTRTHLPVKLVYYEEYPSISQAFKSSLRKKQKDMSIFSGAEKRTKRDTPPCQGPFFHQHHQPLLVLKKSFLRPFGSKRQSRARP